MNIQWNYFSSLDHNFIVLCELLMPCQLFAQKCSNCREITKISMFGGDTLPLVIYIGIFCYWVLLHYNMSFKTIAGGFNGAFWWYGPLSEDREIFNKSTKPILWLKFSSFDRFVICQCSYLYAKRGTRMKEKLQCKLSVKRNLSLLQSDIHWNPLHQNDSYLDTD